MPIGLSNSAPQPTPVPCDNFQNTTMKKNKKSLVMNAKDFTKKNQVELNKAKQISVSQDIIIKDYKGKIKILKEIIKLFE